MNKKFFGRVEGFKKTELRENKKKDLCFKNNVNLIYFKNAEAK